MAEIEKRFSLRLPEDLHADLNQMAEEQSRSLHNLIVVVLRDAVARWKKERQTA
jgi:predicted HicB family RNase H-like nuclease